MSVLISIQTYVDVIFFALIEKCTIVLYLFNMCLNAAHVHFSSIMLFWRKVNIYTEFPT
jgi:predicted permease